MSVMSVGEACCKVSFFKIVSQHDMFVAFYCMLYRKLMTALKKRLNASDPEHKE
jgi:hypothetical protein